MATNTSTAEGTAAQRPITLRERLLGWREIMQTANPPANLPLDGVGKWLVMTRAAVFPMTLWSGTIGALLAVEYGRRVGGVAIDWIGVVLAVVGLVLAHAANNLINDYFDMTGGVDTEGYVRALYAPHPVLSGWVTQGHAAQRGHRPDRRRWPDHARTGGAQSRSRLLIIGFALAGLFLSVFYVAPPFRLKQHGLGELDVFLTWGPLMIGGVYLVATGSVPLWVLVFSAPYALLVTSVLFGKHIDKIEPDTKLGIRTVPVILGESRARRTNQVLMILFYPLIVLAVLAGWVGPWVLLAAHRHTDLDRVLRVYNQPHPAEPAARLSAARLAVVVRRICLPPCPPGRRPADARTAAERAPAGDSCRCPGL